MSEATTVVELNIEPANLTTIVEEWAQKTKFTFYGKAGNRTIYARNIRLARGWLSVEYQGTTARLEAWLSPKGVGPDFTGNVWKGYKVALSGGSSIGPQGIYQREFDELIRLLESKSEKSATAVAAPLRDTRRAGPSKSTYVSTLSGLGIIAIGSSLISIYNASIGLGSFHPDIAQVLSADALAEILFGIVALVCSYFLAKGKLLAIWLYSIAVLAVGSFGFLRGNNFGYLMIGLGALLVWQMFKFRNAWKLV